MLAPTPDTDKHQSIAYCSETYRRVDQALRYATEQFMETGVAFFRNPDVRGLDMYEARKKWRETLSITSPTFVRSYLRRVSKELKRPFLHAEYSAWGDENSPCLIDMTIPKMKRLEPVAFALFLVSEESSGRNWHEKPSNAVANRRDNSVNWYFRFWGTDGEQLIDAWLEQCRSDPIFRHALKTNAVLPVRKEVA